MLPSVRVTTTSLAPSEIGQPTRVSPLPAPSSPRSEAVGELPAAVTATLPVPTVVSTSFRPVPLSLTVTVMNGRAAWMAANSSSRVAVALSVPRSIGTVVPLRRTTLKSVPATSRMPVPWFSSDIGVVAVMPVRLR